jgi:hypothetical protein
LTILELDKEAEVQKQWKTGIVISLDKWQV